MLGVLVGLRAIPNATIAASLGASSFIAFAMPHRPLSQPRRLIGGNVVGLVLGIAGSHLANLSFWQSIPGGSMLVPALCGGLAIGLAILIMVVTDTEHPPAAGLALGLVLDGYTLATLVSVLVGIAALSGLRWLLRKRLVDLL